MKIILCIIVVLTAQIAGATAYTSAATGNWGSSSTWSPSGVPGDGDSATINGGKTVTCNGNIGTTATGINLITVAATGTLNCTGAYTVTFIDTGGFVFTGGSLTESGITVQANTSGGHYYLLNHTNTIASGAASITINAVVPGLGVCGAVVAIYTNNSCIWMYAGDTCTGCLSMTVQGVSWTAAQLNSASALAGIISLDVPAAAWASGYPHINLNKWIGSPLPPLQWTSSYIVSHSMPATPWQFQNNYYQCSVGGVEFLASYTDIFQGIAAVGNAMPPTVGVHCPYTLFISGSNANTTTFSFAYDMIERDPGQTSNSDVVYDIDAGLVNGSSFTNTMLYNIGYAVEDSGFVGVSAVQLNLNGNWYVGNSSSGHGFVHFGNYTVAMTGQICGWDTDANPNSCFIVYSHGIPVSNGMSSLCPSAGTYAVYVGDFGSSPVTSATVKNSLIRGCGISDSSANTWSTSGPASLGSYNNDVSPASYYTGGTSTNFVNGSTCTSHPCAVAKDVTINPYFLAASRRFAACAYSLSGGIYSTDADWWTLMAGRFNGVTQASYPLATPQNCYNILSAGWMPQNIAVANLSDTGGPIGSQTPVVIGAWVQ